MFNKLFKKIKEIDETINIRYEETKRNVFVINILKNGIHIDVNINEGDLDFYISKHENSYKLEDLLLLSKITKVLSNIKKYV